MLTEIDIKKCKRNPDKIKSYIKKTGSTIYTTKQLYIIFPQKFVDKEMSTVANISYILGVFALMDDEYNYSVSLIPSRMNIQQYEIGSIEINNETYMVLTIEQDSELLMGSSVIQDNSIAFPMFDLFFLQGKIPWYIEYNDLPRLFSYLWKYAGSKSGKSILAYKLLTAVIARTKSDPLVEIRNVIKSTKDIDNIDMTYVGLKDIWYSFNSTLSKVAGAYMKMGTVSAIINPEDKVTRLEDIVRE